MSRIPDWDVVVRYISGEETEQVDQCSSPETHRVVQALREAVAIDRDLPESPNAVLARAQLMATMLEQSMEKSSNQSHALRSIEADMPIEYNGRQVNDVRQMSVLPRAVRYVIASVALSVICLTVGWYSGTRHMNAPYASTASVYTTGNGQQATITLPDGSTALLNVGSRLEVPTNYADGNRVLQLRGEALFTVHHNSGSPFTVMAGSSTTRVLGTRFVVRHYATDSVASIAVSQGKVSVGSTVLVENEEIAVSDRVAGEVRRADPAKFSFATGSLKLNAMPLEDAIPELSRWYDADIRLGDSSLATRRVTGECIAGSLADLAEVLELTFDIRVVRVGRVLTLYPKG